MNVVPGWPCTTRQSPSISSSKGGKPGSSGRARDRVGQKCQSGCLGQLLVALVEPIEWLEERDRIADMDEHGQSQLAGRRPQRVQPGVVHRDQASGSISSSQAEQLPDLQAARSGARRVAQSRRFDVAEPIVVREPVVVDAGKGPEAIRMRSVVAPDLRAEDLAPAAIEIDDRFHARAVEQGDQLAHRPVHPAAREGGRAEMGMGIDDRMARPIDDGRWDTHHRSRSVVTEADHAGPTATGRGHQPLRPVMVMPRTKNFWASTKRVTMGKRLTIAPAIISGHLPTMLSLEEG